MRCAVFRLLKTIEHLPVVILKHFDPVALVLVRCFVTIDLILCVLYASFKLLLLVVELVLEGQEMLVERNAVAEERFIATGLILLVHLLIFEQLDLALHSCDLLVQVEDDVLMDSVLLRVLLVPACRLFDLVGCLLQVRVTLKLLVNDGACGTRVDIEVGRAEFDVSGG